jgi:hypothetical protein
MGLADWSAAAEVAQKVDPNPMRLAGRFLGLSGDEQAAGVPTWGWCALALGLGFIGGVMASRSDFLRERLGGG